MSVDEDYAWVKDNAKHFRMNPCELKKKFKKQLEYNEYLREKKEYFTKKRA